MHSGYDMDCQLTAKEAADWFETSIAVICMWRHRGWLDENGERHHLPAHGVRNGRRTYRLGDLFEAERGIRRSRERTGLPPRAKLDSPYARRTA